tara:strand:- start:109 stop:324 length:216 start_codon:yes stop_codon:yes gene_type:complete
MLKKDVNKDWLGVIVNHIYYEGIKYEKIFAHAKLIHKTEDFEDDYYEIMIPSKNFFICYITARKISKFLER